MVFDGSRSCVGYGCWRVDSSSATSEEVEMTYAEAIEEIESLRSEVLRLHSVIVRRELDAVHAREAMNAKRK